MKKKTWGSLFLIFLFTCFLSITIFRNPYHSGHDTYFHVANVLAIEDLIETGKSSSLIVPTIASDFGYGSRIFYPPLAHTVTAFSGVIFNTFTTDISLVFKVIHFLTFYLAGMMMYFLAKKFLKSEKLALFSSLFYMSMPYFISEVYIRCAYAEVLLFIFIPMILLGLLYLLEGDKKHFYPWFVLGYTGAMLSHLTVMVYGTFLFGLFLLTFHKKFFKKETFLPFLTAAGCVFLLTLFFLTPLVCHKLFGNYIVFKEGAMAQNIYWAALTLFDYVNPFSVSDHNDIQMFFPLVVTILLVFTYCFRKKISFPKYTSGFLVFGLASFIMTSVLFPWDFLPSSFRMIQFPWRLQVFVAVAVSLFAPLSLKAIKPSSIIDALVMISLIVGVHLTLHFPNQNLIDFENFWWDGGMGWQTEYLPVSTSYNMTYFRSRGRGILIEDALVDDVHILKDEVPDFSFEVIHLEKSGEFELPRLFYYGYQLVDAEGERIPTYESARGFLAAKIEKEGKYHLTYRGFPVSRWISIVSIFFLPCLYWYTFVKKKKNV